MSIELPRDRVLRARLERATVPLGPGCSVRWRRRRGSNAHGENPNGFQGRGRHQSAGVSKVRKVGDSNARRCDPVRRFQRRSSTSRTPSIVRRRAESNRQGLRSSRFERGAVTTSAGSSRWSGWPDSNRRPPRPERGALTKLRYNPVGMAGVELAASEPPARRATAAPHPGTHPREESNLDPRFRRPVSCPLDHVGMSPVGRS